MFWNDGVVSDIINQENDKMRVIAGKARKNTTCDGKRNGDTSDNRQNQRNLIQYDRTRTLRLYISGSFPEAGNRD